MKLAFNKFKIKIRKDDIKKNIWFLGYYAFWLTLFLIFLDLIFGSYIFYKYAVSAKAQEPQVSEGVIKFNNDIYKNVLTELEKRNRGDVMFSTENESQNIDSKAEITEIANPASVYCVNQGGNLIIKSKEDGSEYGLCYFEDNRACEEWAMLKGECPIGGVKTTGFDTIAQSFCAWSGGKTFATENAVCSFDDGSTCLVDDFYHDICIKGQNLEK